MTLKELNQMKLQAAREGMSIGADLLHGWFESVSPTKDQGDAAALLDLAQKFDATDYGDIAARLEIAIQIEPLLGDRHEEADGLLSKLLVEQPDHKSPAETTLREMGLV